MKASDYLKISKRWPIYLGIVIVILVLTTVFVVQSATDNAKKDEKKSGGAKATVEVYSDYQCPFCASAHFALADIKEDLGGKVEIKYINFPLSSIHPKAKDLAMAAECANRQGALEDFQDYIFARQSYLGQVSDTQRLLVKGARRAGIDETKFKECYEKKETEEIVKQQAEQAEKKGINATPTVFLNGEKIDFESWEQLGEIIKKKAG